MEQINPTEMPAIVGSCRNPNVAASRSGNDTAAGGFPFNMHDAIGGLLPVPDQKAAMRRIGRSPPTPNGGGSLPTPRDAMHMPRLAKDAVAPLVEPNGGLKPEDAYCRPIPKHHNRGESHVR